MKKIKKLYNNLKDYWLGNVIITKDYIWDIDNKKKIYTFTIIAIKYKKGHMLRKIDGKQAFNILKQAIQAQNQNAAFDLYVTWDYGLSQNYFFNKRETRLLINRLTELIKEDVYMGDD